MMSKLIKSFKTKLIEFELTQVDNGDIEVCISDDMEYWLSSSKDLRDSVEDTLTIDKLIELRDLLNEFIEKGDKDE